jgi:hypothetical protein
LLPPDDAAAAEPVRFVGLSQCYAMIRQCPFDLATMPKSEFLNLFVPQNGISRIWISALAIARKAVQLMPLQPFGDSSHNFGG